MRPGACTLSHLKNNPPHTRGENENSTYFFPPSLPDNAKFKGLSSIKAGEISYPGFCSFTPDLRVVFLVSLLAVAKHYYRQSRPRNDFARMQLFASGNVAHAVRIGLNQTNAAFRRARLMQAGRPVIIRPRMPSPLARAGLIIGLALPPRRFQPVTGSTSG